MSDYGLDFSELRDKWREVPQKDGRVFSDQLLSLDQHSFLENWRKYFDWYRKSETDRWYQTLYREFMRDKSVLEIGSGLGFDGALRLQEGLVKDWTFCDIAATNLQSVERVCNELGVRASFVFIDDAFKCFDALGMFDVIWANGSLINVPFEFARAECMRILPHLKPGGRWIELCYPRERWVREGKPPFTEWGKVTDGERTPWVEWYDLIKIKKRLFPAPMEVVLDFNFHNDEYNWFDLMLASNRPFNPLQPVLDVDVFPSGPTPEAHGMAKLSREGAGLDVVTSSALWDYAVSFDLANAFERAGAPNAADELGFTIEADVRVYSGHVGLLIVGEDISAAVHQEFMAAASSESTSLLITVPARVGARRIIFRNTAQDTRSHFMIERLRVRIAGAGAVAGQA